MENINKNLIINIISHKISQEILESIENIDLIISSADDDYCLSLMNEYCCHKKIPMVGVGYINDISTIGPFYIPELTSCLYCNKDIYLERTNYDEKVIRINDAYKAPSTIVNNFFAGAMISSEIIKFFAKDYDGMISINNIIGIHNKTFLLEKIKIEKSPNCIYCGGEHHV
ncbi:Uncharacterised protein [Moraxella bovis]|uniref:THIF-type NAD/FAD binding fold domain-containing protein n=1 Tax=Moraxella bovis TaxID=476 RepID=A0A378PV73_MORBO|nr:ThiF family adenylyltransferase [Moraxella bovis]STY90632.1 Uncharacterised protein [Moraxella bovis]